MKCQHSDVSGAKCGARATHAAPGYFTPRDKTGKARTPRERALWLCAEHADNYNGHRSPLFGPPAAVRLSR